MTTTCDVYGQLTAYWQAPKPTCPKSVSALKKIIAEEVGSELASRIGKQALHRVLRNATVDTKYHNLNGFWLNANAKGESMEISISFDENYTEVESVAVSQFDTATDSWKLAHLCETEFVQTGADNPPYQYLNIKGYYQKTWSSPNTPL